MKRKSNLRALAWLIIIGVLVALIGVIFDGISISIRPKTKQYRVEETYEQIIGTEIDCDATDPYYHTYNDDGSRTDLRTVTSLIEVTNESASVPWYGIIFLCVLCVMIGVYISSLTKGFKVVRLNTNARLARKELRSLHWVCESMPYVENGEEWIQQKGDCVVQIWDRGDDYGYIVNASNGLTPYETHLFSVIASDLINQRQLWRNG